MLLPMVETQNSVYLNLGCGPVQPIDWINVDSSRRAFLASKLSWLDRLLTRLGALPPTEFSEKTVYSNILKRLPWSDASVDGVYLGEVLEHFTSADGIFVLRECVRVLKPGGILRIRVPDNARFWSNYLTEYQSVFSRPRPEWNLDHSRWVAMFFRDICVSPRWFHWKSPGHYHKYMYDEVSLVLALESAGLVHVARRRFLDSDLPGISQVEVRDELIVEGVKP